MLEAASLEDAALDEVNRARKARSVGEGMARAALNGQLSAEQLHETMHRSVDPDLVRAAYARAGKQSAEIFDDSGPLTNNALRAAPRSIPSKVPHHVRVRVLGVTTDEGLAKVELVSVREPEDFLHRLGKGARMKLMFATRFDETFLTQAQTFRLEIDVEISVDLIVRSDRLDHLGALTRIVNPAEVWERIELAFRSQTKDMFADEGSPGRQ